MARELKHVGPNRLEIREYEPAAPKAGQVQVRAEFGAAKHGTEMAFFKGYGRSRGNYDSELHLFEKPQKAPEGFQPGFMGNMFVGTVCQVGPDVRGIEAGDRVCGYGGFRELHTVRADGLFKMAPGASWKAAVCLDPADFAMSALRDGHVRVGDAMAVFGLGAIGLMAVQLAKIAGAHPVIAADPLAIRREAARACGADLVLDPTACDAGKEIKLATEKRGVDVAVEYSGSMHAMQAAIRCVAWGGIVVAGAFPPPYPAGLDLGAEAHMNLPTIVFSRACSEPGRDYPRWDEQRIFRTLWRMVGEGRLTGEPVVTPVVPFEDLPRAYLEIATAPEKNIKLGCEY
jgi:threonine dehydrogenase-like Zn-dependent dehydrogenase